MQLHTLLHVKTKELNDQLLFADHQGTLEHQEYLPIIEFPLYTNQNKWKLSFI